MDDVLLGKTRRELEVRLVPETSLYEVYFKGGGKAPHPLQGRYTNPALAQKAIQQYAESRRKSNSQ